MLLQRHAVAGAVLPSLWREGFALMLWISITAVTDAIASALFDAGHVVISGGAPIVIDDVSSVYQYMHIRMGC